MDTFQEGKFFTELYQSVVGIMCANKKALMAGNYIGLEFYCARPPLIPTQSLCADKPVSKSIGLIVADC